MNKLTDEQVLYARQHYQPGHEQFGLKPLAIKFGVSRDAIKAAIHGVTYKHVGGTIHPVQERPTDELKAAILTEYVPRSPEANVQKLAEKYHLSPTTILKILHEGDTQPKRQRAIITDEIRAAILAEYVPYSPTNGRNALADKYGLSSSAVGVILRALPKEERRAKKVEEPKPALLDELKEAIIIAHDEQELSIRALAERFSLSRQVIKDVLTEAGVELKKRQRIPDEVKDEAIKLYATGNYSVRELSEKLQVNRASLSKILGDIAPQKPQAPTVDQVTIEKILSFYGRGHGISPISKALGIPLSIVRKVINGEI